MADSQKKGGAVSHYCRVNMKKSNFLPRTCRPNCLKQYLWVTEVLHSLQQLELPHVFDQFSPLDKLCEAEGVELVEGLEAASSGLFSTRQFVEGMVADRQKKRGPVSHYCRVNMEKSISSREHVGQTALNNIFGSRKCFSPCNNLSCLKSRKGSVLPFRQALRG